MELYNLYRPITAAPFKHDENYMEFAPCDALKPYICCFWGTERSIRQGKNDAAVKELVTPDTCMDIIFTVDYTNNKIESTRSLLANGRWKDCSVNILEYPRKVWRRWSDTSVYGKNFYITKILWFWMLYISMDTPIRRIYAGILRNIIH